jgi:vacuolar-type H+-ATPase subunit E/Vma4
MSLQDIIKKILADTQGDLQAIQAESAGKKKELEALYATKEAADKKELDAKAAVALKSVEDKTASMARRENSKAIQLSKRELLDEALEKFLVSLQEADDKLYTQVCEKLISALPFKEGTLLVPTKREALTKKMAPDFDVKTTNDFKGGFKATLNGSEIDNSFESLVRSEYRSDLEMYLADQLKLV